MMLRFIFTLAICLTAARADLTTTFKSGGRGDVRSDRLPALRVPAGQSPTPFLEKGAFEVEWTGSLVLTSRQRLYFSFEGEGIAALSIGGEEVLSEEGTLGEAKSERLRLNAGEHEIRIRYQSKPDGSGHFRLFWEERSFPRQSVPPTAFAAAGGTLSPARQGRELFARAHCAKCHIASQGLGSSPMPEVMEIAPILANTGGRLNEAWLAEWIAAPNAKRPGTLMPRLIDDSTEEGRQQAADLAAWLATLKIAEAPAGPDAALAKDGGAHFHRLGCVACHTQPTGASDLGRIPLAEVAHKFQPGALVDFLKKPDQWAPHTGMPDFAFSDEEAKSIAAWLIGESGKVGHKRRAMPKGDASKGPEIAKNLNCGSCHAGLPLDVSTVPTLEAIFEKDWTSEGCVTAKIELPDYSFGTEQKAALSAFAKAGPASLTRHVPAEYSSRQLTTLRCTSCHGIDEVSSLLDTTHLESQDLVAHVEGEDEKLDQSRPHLTFIGEMLHSAYVEYIIDGKATPSPRPWLDMRMPAFHSRASGLATGLAHLHGVEPGAAAAPQPDQAQAAIGKSLVGSEGFGCNTCHAIGDQKATAAFEVEGINFSLSHQRLRKEWFTRWMTHPEKVTPGSKMPRYSENGESQRPDVLEGDANAQFDAIWHFLMAPGD